jgi:hypothetical protein
VSEVRPTTFEMALGMGLVASHPGNRDRLIVPELYRYAVGVRRRGPARDLCSAARKFPQTL